MKQPNYDQKQLKRTYQYKFFRKAENRLPFFGLCGPNPQGYLKVIRKSGFKSIALFDNDSNNLKKLKPIPADLWTSNEDINNNLSYYAFYDLDYCCSIGKIKKFLPKIMKIKEFTMTIALRPTSEEKTLEILKSYNRNFLYRVYREGGCPMMITYFPKIK